jgi:uncharacterized protein (TIGR02271 family)
VNQSNDGERKLLPADESQSLADKRRLLSEGSIDNPKLTLLAEQLSVEKEAVETGRVRVDKQTRTREVFIDEDLLREYAEIERTPIGKQVFEVPPVRQDGETTIIPIVEEVLYTERRLILKEEVKITRRRSTEKFQDRVALRYQEAVVTRVPSTSELADNASAKEMKSSDPRSSKMAYETLVAVYDTPPHADAAVKALKAAGFAESDISVFDSARLKAGRTSLSPGVKEPGLWHRLFGTDVHEHEASIYGQTVEEGGSVISVRVPESEVAHASAVLNIHRPVDVHDRAVTSGIAPAAHVEAVEKKLAAIPLAAEQQVAVSPKLAAAQPDVLRLAEEQLEVGKQIAETGRTRVRRFVTEREVAQDVALHEEHAEVLRKAISDPAYVGEIDWADDTIEIVETAEHALVNKTARIVEEVGLKKVGSDHVETIRDKLRRQQVEIERLGPDGKVIQQPRTA